LLDVLGAPIDGARTLQISLFPNQTPSGGEACHTQTFTGLAISNGYFAVRLGEAANVLQHLVFDAPELWVADTLDGGSERFPRHRLDVAVPRLKGVLLLGSPSPLPTFDASTNVGGLVVDDGAVKVCSVAESAPMAMVSALPFCDGYKSPSGGYVYSGDTGSEVYNIDLDGAGPSLVPNATKLFGNHCVNFVSSGCASEVSGD
jgi:hypothetical protein